MRIAVLGTRGFPNVPGGVEAHCCNLYPLLVEKGCDVTVFTRSGYVDRALFNYRGVNLVTLPSVKNKFLEASIHTFLGVFAARRLSPDILHVHGIGPSLIVPLARAMGLNVVVTNHGPDYERKKWGGFARLVLTMGECLGSRYANAVIAVSESIAGRIRERYKKDSIAIPNGVAIEPSLATDDKIKEHGLIRGKYVLSIGRFVPEKGFHDLIDAFEGIEGWKLAIVGDSNHPDRYAMDLKRKAAKNKSIVLTGFLNGEALQQFYSHAGLFALTSYHEGMPIVLLEAMGYGLSCIASGIPANRGLGLDDDRFFKAGDPGELRKKIKEFINKPLTQEERKRQIDKIAERYSWGGVAARTMEVYRRSGKRE